jgi:hypothetical protein
MSVSEDLGAERGRLEGILGGLTVTGPHGAVALRLLRTYAEWAGVP